MSNLNKEIKLFVSGRLCLFGEHSDWAGAYRRFNSAVEPGQVIIAGTNQVRDWHGYTTSLTMT